MAQSKLTYTNKSNPVPVIDRAKQSTAEDFNDIKQIVNDNADDVDLRFSQNDANVNGVKAKYDKIPRINAIYSELISIEDPGAGYFRFNSISSNIFISYTQGNGKNIKSLLESLNKGSILHLQVSDAKFKIIDVTGAIIDMTTWAIIPISINNEIGSFINDDICGISFDSNNEVADEEDLTVVDKKRKFKDRIATGNQKGYRIIRQDFDFTNIPVNYANSIWEIRYEHDLAGANIIIPQNVTLKFMGGVIANYGIITGDNTMIDAGFVQILDGSGFFDGDWNLSQVFPEWFGAIGDGNTDDKEAIEYARNAVLHKSTLNVPQAELILSSDKIYGITGGLSFIGIQNLNIRGKIIGLSNDSSGLSDYIEIGFTSVLGKRTFNNISELVDVGVIAMGLVNGEIHIGNAPRLTILADNTDGLNLWTTSYSDFYLGSINTFIIESKDNGGSQVPWINENKFYGGRIFNLSIIGDYPCNNNIWYGTKFEGFTANIEKGYCNFFYDCRLEGVCAFTFAAGVFNTIFYRSYYQIEQQYYRNNPSLNFTIIDNGSNNGIVDSMDIGYNKEMLFDLHINSRNFSLQNFIRNKNFLSTSATGSYKEIFNTGIIELTSEFGLALKVDEVGICQPFIYCYDTNGDLITSEPTTAPVKGINIRWDDVNNRYDANGSSPVDWYGIGFNPVSGIKYVKIIYRTNIANNIEFRRLRIIKIDKKSDPVPITPVNKINYSNTTRPTSGYWYINDYVENDNPIEEGTSGSKYITRGWLRLTEGSSHAHNTDWRDVRMLTGN